MKMAFKIIGGIAAGLVILIGVVFLFTGGLVDSADQVFADLKDGEPRTAYDRLSGDFRAATPYDAFVRFVEGNGLDQVTDTTWSARNISGSQGTLSGTVTTENRGDIPVTLHFVSEDGNWKIQRIDRAAAGLTQNATTRFPPKPQQIALIKDSLLSWNRALQTSDFTDFLANSSLLFQGQMSSQRITEAFREFIDGGVDISFMEDETPATMTPPYLDENGAMVLAGFFAGENSPVRYKLTYFNESGDWKLFGIQVVTPLIQPSN